MFITFGTRFYGSVDRCGETHIATKFFHVYYLPIFPTGSMLITSQSPDGKQVRGVPLGLHGRSVLAGYARLWLPLAAVVIGLEALLSWGEAEVHGYGAPILSTAVGVAVAALGAGAWLWLGRLGHEDRARRLVYQQFTGLPADPALLGEGRDAVREKLHAQVCERAAQLAATGYRSSLGPAADWIDVALDPTVSDANLLAASLTLVRLEAALSEGERRLAWNGKHDQVWARLKQIDPSVLQTSVRI